MQLKGLPQKLCIRQAYRYHRIIPHFFYFLLVTVDPPRQRNQSYQWKGQRVLEARISLVLFPATRVPGTVYPSKWKNFLSERAAITLILHWTRATSVLLISQPAVPVSLPGKEGSRVRLFKGKGMENRGLARFIGKPMTVLGKRAISVFVSWLKWRVQTNRRWLNRSVNWSPIFDFQIPSFVASRSQSLLSTFFFSYTEVHFFLSPGI